MEQVKWDGKLNLRFPDKKQPNCLNGFIMHCGGIAINPSPNRDARRHEMRVGYFLDNLIGPLPMAREDIESQLAGISCPAKEFTETMTGAIEYFASREYRYPEE